MTNYVGNASDNSYKITTADGNSSVDGNGGTDSLVIDWSTNNSNQSGYWSPVQYGGYAEVHTSNLHVDVEDVEFLTLLSGGGADSFTMVNLNGIVAFNGGGGTDLFTADFSLSTANISFTLNATAGSTSTFVGQGSSVTNVEQLYIATASGNDSLTGGALADTFYVGTGTNSVYGGGGDDQIYSSGIDTINGGGGTADYWLGDYTSLTTALNVTQNGAVYNFSNGGSVTNVERIDLRTGSGNDNFTISNLVGFDAGSGIDSVTMDWSASSGRQNGSLRDPVYGSAFQAYDANTGLAISGSNIESATVKFGGNDDEFSVRGNVTVAFDGGAGTDKFEGLFSASTENISFTLDQTAGSTSTFAGQGSSVKNVEEVEIWTGSGDDSLTGAALDDTFFVFNGTNSVNGGGGDDYIRSSGIDTIDGGDGDADFWVGDYNDGQTIPLIVTTSGNSYSLSNGSSVTNVEQVEILTGSGDDSFTITNSGSFSGSEGTDSFTLDWSASNAHQIGTFYNNMLSAISGDGNSVSTGAMEAYTVKFGSGDSELDLRINIIVAFDGGAGTDYFRANFNSVSANVDFTLNQATGSTSTFFGQGSTLRGVERVKINTGFGNDSLTGGALDDYLSSSGGNDLIDGGAGADNLDGGGGNDTLSYASSVNAITFSLKSNQNKSYNAGNGIDYVTGFENLIGSAYNDMLSGNTSDNRIDGGGGAGNDILDGGTGADALIGNGGNDIYVIDNAGDVVTEAAGQGTDEVRTVLASYTLGAEVENLTGTLNNGQTLTGNGLGNVITGGAGADTMAGGLGNDVYYVNNSGDVVTEGNGQGTDTIYSSVNYTLVGRYVETLVLTGTNNISATGNAFANILVGNDGNNALSGGGGADGMTGGLGNDIYTVDNAGDSVTELVGEGADEVRTGLANYTLAAHVETLTGTGGSGQSLTGNALDNSIGAGIGNDVLNGGLGADRMAGSYGDDVYYVDDIGDNVVESNNRGTDTIYSSVSYNLNARYVETLALTGSADIGATGNGLANILIGNSGGNMLAGLGGNDGLDGGDGDDVLDGSAGNDVLTGGAGLDQFRFASPLNSGNVDTIMDFIVADDSVFLSASVFAAAGPAGVLSADAFAVGLAAADASDRIIYDGVNGRLLYDADGTGAGTAVIFATITQGLAMTNADFIIG